MGIEVIIEDGYIFSMTSSRSYLDIVDHAYSLEQFYCEAQGGTNNYARHEGEFNGP